MMFLIMFFIIFLIVGFIAGGNFFGGRDFSIGGGILGALVALVAILVLGAISYQRTKRKVTSQLMDLCLVKYKYTFTRRSLDARRNINVNYYNVFNLDSADDFDEFFKDFVSIIHDFLNFQLIVGEETLAKLNHDILGNRFVQGYVYGLHLCLLDAMGFNHDNLLHDEEKTKDKLLRVSYATIFDIATGVMAYGTAKQSATNEIFLKGQMKAISEMNAWIDFEKIPSGLSIALGLRVIV